MRPLALTFCLAVFGLHGCGSGAAFPEDQIISGPIEFGEEWAHIELDSPLEVNHEGLQGLHVVLDPQKFTPNHEFDNELANNPDHLFDIRNSFGELVIPEVILVGESGAEIELRSSSNVRLYDEEGVTVGMGMVESTYAPPPPFPDHMDEFVSIRIRSNIPFTADHLRWIVERHPEMFQ